MMRRRSIVIIIIIISPVRSGTFIHSGLLRTADQAMTPCNQLRHCLLSHNSVHPPQRQHRLGRRERQTLTTNKRWLLDKLALIMIDSRLPGRRFHSFELSSSAGGLKRSTVQFVGPNLVAARGATRPPQPARPDRWIEIAMRIAF